MSGPHPYVTFISELKAIRCARGLTQQQVAKKIKLSRPQYAAIEHGRSIASFKHVYNLAVALGVHWIIGNPDNPRSSEIVAAK